MSKIIQYLRHKHLDSLDSITSQYENGRMYGGKVFKVSIMSYHRDFYLMDHRQDIKCSFIVTLYFDILVKI